MVDCDSERIWKIVEGNRLNVPKKQRSATVPLSLFDRLYDCYVECKQNALDKSFDKRFKNTVNLLQQLESDHVTPSLVVSLYADERGYSLMLCPRQGMESEEIFMPYEDNEIFSYLDNQEIPPVVLEVLEKTKYCHLHSWCVVCEVRDYRSCSSQGGFEKHLLLLRPTTETILATVNQLARDSKCSPEEKLFIESRVLLATQPPVCLDPSTDVVCVTNRLQYNRRKFNTPAMRRYLRRRSQANRSRMYLSSQSEAPAGLVLHDFISNSVPPAPAKRDFSSSWKRRRLDVPPPSSIDAFCEEVLRCAGRQSAMQSPTTLNKELPAWLSPSSHTGFADELLMNKPLQTTPPPPPSQPAPTPPPSQPAPLPPPSQPTPLPPPSQPAHVHQPSQPPPLPPPSQPAPPSQPPPPSQPSHVHQPTTPQTLPAIPKMKLLTQPSISFQMPKPPPTALFRPPIVIAARPCNRPIAPAPPQRTTPQTAKRTLANPPTSQPTASPVIAAITQAITNPATQANMPKLSFLPKATPTIPAPPLPTSATPTMPILHKIAPGSTSQKGGSFPGGRAAAGVPLQSSGQVVRSQGGGAVVMVTRSSQGQVGLVSVQVKQASPQTSVAMPTLTPSSNLPASQSKGKNKK